MKIILTFTLLMIPGVVNSISVTGYSGGGVTIKCKYGEEYTANPKYFCRRDILKICSDLIKTDIQDKWFDAGRFSLYDNTSSAVLKVTIRNLSEEDSDTYYCGIDIFIFADLYIEVNLTVITETNDLNTPYPSSSSPSSSVKTQMITLTSLDTTSTISGSSVIFISEVLVLLLIGVSMFLLAVRKYKQTHGFLGDEVTQVSCSYVTVSKTDLHSDLNHTDTRTTVVYSAVHLPINPSD